MSPSQIVARSNLAAGDQAPVERDIIFRHPLRGEPLFKHLPDLGPVEQVQSPAADAVSVSLATMKQ